MKILSRDRRVQRYLDRQLCAPAFRWGDLTDPRARRGRRWALSELLNGAFTGLLAGCASLRDVEAMTEEMGPSGRKYVSRRVPDTTLWDLLPRLSASELSAKLHQQVRAAWRSKTLAPVDLPCGVVAIDGKGLGALEHDADGTAQKAHRAHDGTPYWLARMLRAVLTSAASKPCLDQKPIGAKTNELGSATGFFDDLMAAYGQGDLFEIVTLDAGIVSRALAEHIDAANKGYVMALKGTQPELLAEAKRLLPKRPAEFETVETYRGNSVRRRLMRTTEIAAYHDWKHLRQAWLVVQETQRVDGTVEIDERYFLTTLPAARLSATQVLAVVRGHWGIENDCFWTLDTQWNEDHIPWCSSGRAVETLSWLRLMAYNVIAAVRRVHLRRRLADGTREPAAPWRRVLHWVRDAWRLALPDTTERVSVCG